METHIIEIIRFTVYVLTVVLGLICMIKAQDRSVFRLFSGAAAAVTVGFNVQISQVLYLILGSALETLFAAMSVGFIILLAAVIMLFPLLAAARWLIR